MNKTISMAEMRRNGAAIVQAMRSGDIVYIHNNKEPLFRLQSLPKNAKIPNDKIITFSQFKHVDDHWQIRAVVQAGGTFYLVFRNVMVKLDRHPKGQYDIIDDYIKDKRLGLI